MNLNEFNLRRFLNAQEQSYSVALRELRAGRKRSHWIWYIFPQLAGLGQSANSEFYGVDGLAEARANLANPLLRQRLQEAVDTMLAHRALHAAAVLGELDVLEFRSCLTLFSLADSTEPIFADALDQFFLDILMCGPSTR